MNADELRAWIREVPFRSSLVCLSDGRTLQVADSSTVALLGDQLAIASPLSDEHVIIPLEEVVELQPLSQSQLEAIQPDDENSPFKSAFRCWERLRPWYNGVLVLWTLGLILLTWDSFTWWAAEQGHHGRTFQLGFLVVVGAMFANGCFFAGPLVVGYTRWLGLSLRGLTPVLFMSGTLFTMLLAMFVVIACAAPPM